jgi:hypothetical protein
MISPETDIFFPTNSSFTLAISIAGGRMSKAPAYSVNKPTREHAKLNKVKPFSTISTHTGFSLEVFYK